MLNQLALYLVAAAYIGLAAWWLFVVGRTVYELIWGNALDLNHRPGSEDERLHKIDRSAGGF